jgi:hypothetical protein
VPAREERRLFSLFSFTSFFSIWYWVLTVLVWTLVCYRTLGVPHDMLLRGQRLPEVAERVDLIAGIHAQRIAALADRAGVPAAALMGFALAALGALGFLTGIEAAKASFMLLFPLSLAGAGVLRLALQVRRKGLHGEGLRRRLMRRRTMNQVIATLAILTAAVAALGHPPRALPF